MNNLCVGVRYKLKDNVQPITSGPIEYQNESAVLTEILAGGYGGLFFKDGLGGIRYWNAEDVEEA